MLSLRNTQFNPHHLFLSLSAKEFENLDVLGCLSFNDEMPNVDMLTDDKRYINDGDICLAGPETAEIFSQYLDNFNVLSFESCLRNIRVVQYRLLNSVHILHKYFNDDLLSAIEREHAIKSHDETEFDIKRYPFIHDPRNDAPPYKCGHVWAGPKTKSLSGRFSLCSCGEDGCGVDLALIRDFEILVFIPTSSTYICEIRILPDSMPKQNRLQ